MQVRTALDKLKVTQEVTQYQHTDYTFLQLNNWGKYQEWVTQKVTQKQHSDNTAITTIEEGNKGIKEEDTNTAIFFEKSLEGINNETLNQALRDWWLYKKGKYTEIGWNKTLKVVSKHHPLDVSERIDEAISSSWIGMNLNTILTPRPPPTAMIARTAIDYSTL